MLNKGTAYDQYQPVAFHMRGGDWPMSGNPNSPAIEIGLDYSTMEHIGEGTANLGFFSHSSSATGFLHNFSIIDYRNGTPFELASPQTNVPFVYHSKW